MSIFKGAGVAIVTPFTQDDKVNFEELGKMIDFQIAGGTDAIIIRELDKEISEVESAIDKITSQMDSPIFTIPGIEKSISQISGATLFHVSITVLQLP